MSVEIFDEIFNASSIKPWLKDHIDQEFTHILMEKIVQNIISDTEINTEFTRMIVVGFKHYFSKPELKIENKEILDSIDKDIMNNIRSKRNGIEKSVDIIKNTIKNSKLLNDAISKEFDEFFKKLSESETQQHLLIPEFDSIFKQSIQTLIQEYSDVLNKSFNDFMIKDTELHKNIIKFFKEDIISRMIKKLDSCTQESEFEEMEETNRNIVLKLRRTLENDRKENDKAYELILSNELLLNNIEVSTLDLIPESIKCFNIREFSDIFKDSNEEFVKKSISEHLDINHINNTFFTIIENILKSSKLIVDQTYKNIILDKFNRILESNLDIKKNFEEFIYRTITGNNQISAVLERIKNNINTDLVKLLIPNLKSGIQINEQMIDSYHKTIKEAYIQAFHEIIEQNHIKGVCYCSKCKNTIIYDLEENENRYEVLCRKCK